MSDRLDYKGFYQRLYGLVASKASGTLFAKTEKNHLIIIAVRDGKIISLAYGPRHGTAAIPLIRQMVAADVRFDDSAIPYHERELPPTAQIIDSLKPGSGADAPRAPAPSASNAPAPEGGGLETKLTLCQLLTDYIGPVAPLVCEEKVAASGGLDDPDRFEDVIHGLAREILNPNEAQEFVVRARTLLQTRVAGSGGPAAAAPIAGPDLSPVDLAKAKESLCELLTGYLGPFAPIICEEKIATMSGDQPEELQAAIQEISQEIEDTAEAEEFIVEAWKRLHALGARGI